MLILMTDSAGTYKEIHGHLGNAGSMSEAEKARVVGFNHVATEVGNIDEPLSFYARIFKFELRSKSKDMAFIDLARIMHEGHWARPCELILDFRQRYLAALFGGRWGVPGVVGRWWLIWFGARSGASAPSVRR
jgi:hypothetical protein